MTLDTKPSSRPQGLIFFSHSHEDKDVVSQIVSRFDQSIIFYDLKTITPGTDNIKAMRDGVLRASVFVFFVSPNVDVESWALYEAEIAEIKNIKESGFQVLAVPIKGATYRDAPDWMHNYFAVPETYTISDVSRTLIHLYEKALTAQGLLREEVFSGREKLQIEIQLEARGYLAQKGVPLNAIILNGIPGMGRTTLARHLLPQTFPGLRQGNPIFDLPDAAGAIDIYLKLFEDIYGLRSKKSIEDHVSTFPSEPEDQAELIFGLLRHWSEINQPIILKSRWGLRSRGNEIEPFVRHLFKKLKSEPNLKVIFVTTRRLPPPVLNEHENVIQFEVSELEDGAIADIITRIVPPAAAETSLILSLAPKILGHPATAHYVSFLVKSGRSLESILSAPEDIYAFQDKVLSAIYDEDILNDLEKDVLSILSWFPNLPISFLAKILSDSKERDVAAAVWNLYDHSLLTQTETGGYKVPELVRSRTRRDIDRLSADLHGKIRIELEDILDSDHLPVDFIDAILFAFSSSGEEIPDSVKSLITGSTLRSVVERQHDLGRGATERKSLVQHYTTVAKLAKLAKYISIPNKHTLEDIYFFGGDALARIGEDPRLFIEAMREEGFSSADYLEGSYKYHKLRDYTGAIIALKRALSAGYFKRRTARLLARLYMRTGKPAEALTTIDELPNATILRDTGFLSMKLRALRATGNYEAAGKMETALRRLDDEYGEYEIFKAATSLREGRRGDARQWIKRARMKPRTNKVTLAFFDCVIRLQGGDDSTLSEACELARAAGREDDARQLLARAALMRDDVETADKYIREIENKNFFDFQLEHKIIQKLKEDNNVMNNAVLLKELEEREREVLVRSRRVPEYAE